MKAVVLVAILAACGGGAAPPPEEPLGEVGELPGEGFRRRAGEIAADRGLAVIVLGSARWIHSDGEPRRYALMRPEGAGRGAYLIELAPGDLLLITFSWDAATVPWRVERERDEAAIEHRQGEELIRIHLWQGAPHVTAHQRGEVRTHYENEGTPLDDVDSAADFAVERVGQ
jgi:hypothetical protein